MIGKVGARLKGVHTQSAGSQIRGMLGGIVKRSLAMVALPVRQTIAKAFGLDDATQHFLVGGECLQFSQVVARRAKAEKSTLPSTMRSATVVLARVVNGLSLTS